MHPQPIEIEEQRVADRSTSEPGFTANARRMLDALDSLGAEEREVFGLVRVQGLTHEEAAEVLCVSTKTVQRRLNRGRMQLVGLLKDLEPQDESRDTDAAGI
jgi:RNA polymerase sigma-70 factor (ECF subfamily)